MAYKIKLDELPLSSALRFTFQRFGRAYHLRIETVADLKLVLALDSAHWVATSASVKTLNLDSVFLSRVDTNEDGYIRAEEVRQAVRKLFDLIEDTSGVAPGNTVLALNALRRDVEEGQRIYDTALKMLERLGAPDASRITLEQVRQVKHTEKERGLSEAGLVLPGAAEENRLRTFFQDLLATVGGEPHSEGAKAVSEKRLEQFLEESRTYLAWAAQAELTEGETATAILLLGADTEAAYTLFTALEHKIDQYFTLSDAARLDPALAEQVWPGKTQLDQINFLDAKAVQTFLDEAPLARPSPTGSLAFSTPLNPRYAARVERFRKTVLARLMDEKAEVLTPSVWKQVKAQFEPYAAWLAARPDVHVGALPTEALRRYLDDPYYADATHALIAESHTTAVALEDVRLVEKVILYQAYLMPFVNSFVSFPELYHPKKRALFEMGTLVMDGRHFTLSVKVTDRAQHARFSDASNMFVLYVSVREKEGGECYEVAVPVTAGGRGNLQIGKRGVFYDVNGKESHAQVVHLVKNPISLLEAILTPFTRMAEGLNAMIERMSGQREEQLFEQGGTVLHEVGTLATLAGTEQAQLPPASVAHSPAGLLAGGAVAVAALGSSVAFITKTLQGLGWLTIGGGVLGLVLIVLIPVIIVAYIKLRRRDLSAILEGSDWGINARMRLTRRQARTFTSKPSYPLGSRGIRYRAWWVWVVLASAIGVALFFLLT